MVSYTIEDLKRYKEKLREDITVEEFINSIQDSEYVFNN